jgi:hypothetical protein
MNWEKKGLIFAPQGTSDWLVTHAAVPVADRIRQDIFRVYFCSRDQRNRAQIGFFDIDLKRPAEILYLHDRPVITLGPQGAFDDNGVTPSCIVNYQQKKYQYYSGWSLGVTVPFYFYVGLAVSEDEGETYQRVSAAPILGRSAFDPYLTASPWVMIEEGTWRMWYVSGTGWQMKNNRARPCYHIKYAESSDGINWQRDGVICIDYQSRDENAFAHPCVVKADGLYKMWYSYKGENYRIGYAESNDGIKWTRKDDEVGIDVSASDWDSEMIEYACVFEHMGRYHMLYNGNDYGKSGIGLAVLEAQSALIPR